MPGVKVTPVGSDPMSDSVGVGVPVAVTVKLPADNTVNVVAFKLVILGATGVAAGVTITVPEATPVSMAALLALTEQV